MSSTTEKAFKITDSTLTKVNKLFHIASMCDSREFHSLIEDIDIEDLQKIIPSVTEERLCGYEYRLGDLFIDEELYGFIAECWFNIPENISLKEDGSFRCCTNSSRWIEFYVYAETLDELYDKILVESEVLFDEAISNKKSELTKHRL